MQTRKTIKMKLIFLLLPISYCHALDSWVCSANTDAFVTSSKHAEAEHRLQALEVQVQQLQKLVQQHSPTFSTIDGIPRDCEEIYENGTRKDGIYSISPDGRCPFFVYCEVTHEGWTVIQVRYRNESTNWKNYVSGFGHMDGSHWLGLDKIHRLTRDGSQIYFDMKIMTVRPFMRTIKCSSLNGAATSYIMNVDAFGYEGSIKELLSYHNGMKFSTYDRDNDAHSGNCCKDSLDGGGWWYNACSRLGNLNGVYGKREEGGIGYWHGRAILIKQVLIRVKRMQGTC